MRFHSPVALGIGNHYFRLEGVGEQAMAEMSSATAHRHGISPVDVFVGGIVGAVVGIVAILAALYVPLPTGLTFGFRLGGFFFLAVGATAAALALLRAEDAVQRGTELHGRPANSA